MPRTVLPNTFHPISDQETVVQHSDGAPCCRWKVLERPVVARGTVPDRHRPTRNERSMATKPLTTDTFAQEVQSVGIVLVDVWADWCGPCKMFAPIFEDASESNPDITFGKVDTDAEPALSQALQITSIPTLMIFRDGIRV